MQRTGIIDPGRTIDWGKTSEDYARHRPGPPSSFFEKIRSLDIGKKDQVILDLGTGTGLIAREFSRRGVRNVFGTDISLEQINMANALAKKENLAGNLSVQFSVAAAEVQPFFLVAAT